MREQIKFGLIHNAEEFSGLKEFAKSFDHRVGNDSVLPIYTIERGQQMIGYFNLILYPIVCPSFHPKLCSHRDFHDAVQYAKNHFCLNSIDGRYPNGTCLLALPIKLAIRKSAVEHMGFKRTGREIWQAIP